MPMPKNKVIKPVLTHLASPAHTLNTLWNMFKIYAAAGQRRCSACRGNIPDCPTNTLELGTRDMPHNHTIG